MSKPQSTPLVRFKQVSKTYPGNVHVVEGLNLDIMQGEFLTLLGPSGSGKTTTLMMLAGFETPTEGSIEMAGQRIDTVPPHRRDIGVVFQNYALFPHLTIAENLAFPLQARRMAAGEIAKRVREGLEMVHLGNLGGRRPAQLSGGQQQRIALARALIFRPKLVVLDEPLGALDKNLREHMQLELKRLHKELGVTMVFVTHDQSEALTMSDRVAVFDKGRIQQIDTPLHLYHRPQTRFVASFLGENNLVAGQVESVNDGIVTFKAAAGGLLRARSDGALGNGQSSMLALRPERIELHTALHEQTIAARQVLQGTVREVIFLGDQYKLLVTMDGMGDAAVRLSACAADGEIRPGDRQNFSYRIDACSIVAADSGPSPQ